MLEIQDLLPLIQSGNLHAINAKLANLEDDADITTLSEQGLIAAMQAGYSKIASTLVNHPLFNAQLANGENLRQAITLGYLDVAETLIIKGAAINQYSTDHGSALHLALDREYFPLVTHMLAHGAELSIRTDKGWTPLIWAAIIGREKIVDFLLSHNADLHICNNDGWNAVTGAFVKRHHTIVEKLLAKGAYFGQRYAEAVLLSAFKDGHLNLFTRLVKEGANVNLIDEKNNPLLILAIQRGGKDAVQLLLAHGADSCAKSGDNKTALGIALDSANYEITEALLDAGADPNSSGNWTWSPLHFAASHGNAHICQLLLKKGASINQPTDAKTATTPLMLAASNNHLAAVTVLCEAGAQINLKNAKGTRALSFAGMSLGKPTTASAKYLLAQGALE